MSVSGEVAARISQSNPFKGCIVTAADIQRNLVFALPIENLGLPARLLNGIHRGTTAVYVAELIQLSDFDVRNPYIGKKGLEQLHGALRERQLGLSMKVDWPEDSGVLRSYLIKNCTKASWAESLSKLIFEPVLDRMQPIDPVENHRAKVSAAVLGVSDILTPRQLLAKRRGALKL